MLEVKPNIKLQNFFKTCKYFNIQFKRLINKLCQNTMDFYSFWLMSLKSYCWTRIHCRDAKNIKTLSKVKS